MAELHPDIESVILSEDDIKQIVGRLGQEVSRDYEGKNPLVVAVLRGAFVFTADLLRQITVPCAVDFMAVSSYGAATKTSGVVNLVKDLTADITGMDVLIVEDIVDSGMTLSYLKKYLSTRGAASIKIATLLDKPERRRVELNADYFCFTIPDEFVVGYGLDYAEVYRNMPDIGVLKPSVYTEE